MDRSNPAMKRLGICIPELAGGGSERVITRLLAYMAGAHPAIELHLIVLRPTFEYEVPPSVKVHVLYSSAERAAGRLRRRLAQPLVLMRLAALVRRQRLDTLLSFLPHPNLYNCFGKMLGNWPRCVISERVSLRANYKGYRWRVMSALVRFIYRHADAVIAVSDGVKRELESMGLRPERVFAIPNAVDASELADKAGRPDVEQGLVVTAARLEHQKGIDTLITAFARVVKEVPGARLRILGKGPLLRALQEQAKGLDIEGSVEFSGFAANPFAEIAKAEVYVMPSRWEGFPNSLLEAAALGKAIAATDCPFGARELLEDGKNGKLVPVDDADALAAAIVTLLTDKTERGAFQRAALEGARRYAPPAIFERYRAVLEGRT